MCQGLKPSLDGGFQLRAGIPVYLSIYRFRAMEPNTTVLKLADFLAVLRGNHPQLIDDLMRRIDPFLRRVIRLGATGQTKAPRRGHDRHSSITFEGFPPSERRRSLEYERAIRFGWMACGGGPQ